MNEIKKIIRNTNEKNQDKINWTKAWSTKYPILKKYQKKVDIKNMLMNLEKYLISYKMNMDIMNLIQCWY